MLNRPVQLHPVDDTRKVWGSVAAMGPLAVQMTCHPDTQRQKCGPEPVARNFSGAGPMGLGYHEEGR
jgi:hypothetical protein